MDVLVICRIKLIYSVTKLTSFLGAMQRTVIPIVLPVSFSRINFFFIVFMCQGVLHGFNIPRDEQEAAEGVS